MLKLNVVQYNSVDPYTGIIITGTEGSSVQEGPGDSETRI